MMILSLLWMFCLISGAFSIGHPTNDYWREYGPYGACSRTCGTGVAVRTRICNTMRTDGGHNCVGPSKSYKLCNTQECADGSRDFREQQCSLFDQTEFQGKSYTWRPYHGGSNPCELVCVPSGENFYYRHQAAVVDGTPCYTGRRDVCVEGVCRAVSRGKIVDLEDRSFPVTSRHDTEEVNHIIGTYRYTYEPYSECSVHCGQGIQTRTVQCINERTSVVVDDSHCMAQGHRRLTSQQACNQRPCVEYSVGPFGDCSVTCGKGQQTREVFCIRDRGRRIPEHHCSSLTRPHDITSCQRPACQQVFRYYTNDFSLCTRSCGTGTRERRVVCMDLDHNQYAEERCASLRKPHTVENCNTQTCPSAQMVPSVQNPNGYENTLRGLVPHTHDAPLVYRPSDPYPAVIGPYCAQSYFGCCPNGHTAASGPLGEGCAKKDCNRTRYGCCLDGVTAAQGFKRAGCPEFNRDYSSDRVHSTSVCGLARDDGPCYEWTSRFFFDRSSDSCSHFWYGGCHGNGNNFVSKEECERTCKGAVRVLAPREPTSRKGIKPIKVYKMRSRAHKF
ncbi:papilin b, proteoglycan-like sulfated glycoprotein [Triplophysa rosa]|uniref:Papilin b n=1 Tax=Triplophysa rosa TaxID=992332 RepID=A0A9W7TPW4_TRIRA|nr:papilin b, proteoglycan-like sulfated glycoprotein [Triplophysa rosa]KAI7799824.1 papilin b [Triplophysa rosa]